jgi:hypothetical protein
MLLGLAMGVVYMFKSLKIKILAIKIEWYWFFIMRCRKKGKLLFEKGQPYTSDRILKLSKRLDRYCDNVWLLECRYMSELGDQFGEPKEQRSSTHSSR